MSEWKDYKLGDIASFSYGKLPKHDLLGKGCYVTFSGYKYIERYPEYNCEKGDVILVARGVGGTGDVKLTTQRCFLTNLSIKLDLDNRIVLNDYFYNMFRQENLRYLDSGSAQSQITIQDLANVIIEVPSIDKQKRIAGVLSSLDDKIDLLHRENATLEALAETLFRHYFIENPNPDWKEGKLGDVCHYVTDKMETSSLTTISYISTENMLNDKQGVTEASSIPDDIRVTRYGVGDILLSNIRPYFKKIWLADRRGGCSNDVLCIRANEKEFDCFVYYTLRQDDFFDYVMLGSKGCKMPRGDKQHIMNWPIYLPNVESFGVFNKPVYLMIQKIKSNQQQIQTLTTKRDTLLPRLMSGEVNVVAH